MEIDLMARPKPGETDEDIIRFQEEFLRRSTLIGMDKRPNVNPPVDEQSKRLKSDTDDPPLETVLCDVVERIGDCPIKSDLKIEVEHSKPFPLVHRCDRKDHTEFIALYTTHDTCKVEFLSSVSDLLKTTSTSTRVRSIFAQQMKRLKVDRNTTNSVPISALVIERASPSSNPPTFFYTSNTSSIVDGSGLDASKGQQLAMEIHEENLATMARASSFEIIEQQRRLTETLDSKLLDFIKSRRPRPRPINKDIDLQTNSVPVSMQIETNTSTTKFTATDVLSQSSKFLHMDKLETDKLAWTTLLEEPSTSLTDMKSGYLARFDFDGVLVSREVDVPVHHGLHHHGNEPEIAGYTLDELFVYARSSILQQRLLAFTTLARILERELRWDTLHKRLSDGDMNLFTKMLSGVCPVPTSSSITRAGYIGRGDHSGKLRELCARTDSYYWSFLLRVIRQWNSLLNSKGHYDECLLDPEQFLSGLLDSGLVLLLRWALDDNSVSCLTPTIGAINALIVSESDEHFLDKTFSWNEGHKQPYMQTVNNCSNNAEETPNKDSQLTDAELVKIDVVKGIVRMDLLPRLRYILEVLRPSSSPAIVIHSLSILIRISRHSRQIAETVARCPRLLETVVREFIPKAWNLQDEKLSSLYGVPLRLAVKLIRTLASVSRPLALEILQNHDIMSSLLCFASAIPKDSKGHLDPEVLLLSLEAYRTWSVFLRYGLTVDQFSDFFPLIVHQLQSYQALCLNEDVVDFDCEHASEVINLLTSVLKLSVSDNATRSVSWNLVVGFGLPMELCLKKWLHELSQADETKVESSSLKLVGVALTFVATFYEVSWIMACRDSVKCGIQLNDLFTETIVPFLESTCFQKILSMLIPSSALLSEFRPKTNGGVSALSFLDSLVWSGNLNNVLQERSPFPLLSHLVHALLIFSNIDTGLRDEFLGTLLDNLELKSYFRRLSSTTNNQIIRPCWFGRFEIHFNCNLLILFSRVSPSIKFDDIYYAVAVSMLYRLQDGDEQLVADLISSVIFNADLIRNKVDDIEASVQVLQINQETCPSNLRINLLEETYSNLLRISKTYLRSIRNGKLNTMKHMNSFTDIGSLMVNFLSETVITNSFQYLPIVALFSEDSKCPEISSKNEKLKKIDILHCLQWSHLMDFQINLKASSTSLKQLFKPEAKFCYLALVFLINGEIFLEPCVKHYLKDNLLLMSESGQLNSMNLSSSPIPEIPHFYDFYDLLLLQFEAVSYGDRVFGIFVILPTQMRYPVRLRRALWAEHRSSLRILGVRHDELPVSVSEFLEPSENDSIVLDCYLSALLNGQVRPNWSPFMYLVAIHHVHRFLFSPSLSEEEQADIQRQAMIEKLHAFKTSEMYKHLTLYKGPDNFNTKANDT